MRNWGLRRLQQQGKGTGRSIGVMGRKRCGYFDKEEDQKN